MVASVASTSLVANSPLRCSAQSSSSCRGERAAVPASCSDIVRSFRDPGQCGTQRHDDETVAHEVTQVSELRPAACNRRQNTARQDEIHGQGGWHGRQDECDGTPGKWTQGALGAGPERLAARRVRHTLTHPSTVALVSAFWPGYSERSSEIRIHHGGRTRLRPS